MADSSLLNLLELDQEVMQVSDEGEAKAWREKEICGKQENDLEEKAVGLYG